MIYEQAGHDNKKLNRAPKLNDRKYTVQMIGEQVKEDANSQYTSQAIAERIPALVIAANIISKIKKETTNVL